MTHRAAILLSAWPRRALLAVIAALCAIGLGGGETATAEGSIVITQGGTYSGDWRNDDPSGAAVTIRTSDPVVIDGATIRSKGDAVWVEARGASVTIRNSRAYGLDPGGGAFIGRFFEAGRPRHVAIENNDLEATGGIAIVRFEGRGTVDETVRISRNRVRNIVGATKAASRSFIGLDKVHAGSIEIAWNEVVNEPFHSRVGDNINFYLSGGTRESPAEVHDNYVEGAYPPDPTSDPFPGGGIITDGPADPTLESAFVHVHHNQIVATTNYGIAIANGHDNLFEANRVIWCGHLSDGRPVRAAGGPAYVWNIQKSPRWANNRLRDNEFGTIGRSRDTGAYKPSSPWFPDCADCEGNRTIEGPITAASEAAEFARWRKKVEAAGVIVGAPLGPKTKG